MQSWAYKHQFIDVADKPFLDWSQLGDANEAGIHGWELVSVVPLNFRGGDVLHLFFKRPIE